MTKLLKVITAGDGGVGKTTLLYRYVEGQFLADTKVTLGVEFWSKSYLLEENQLIYKSGILEVKNISDLY